MKNNLSRAAIITLAVLLILACLPVSNLVGPEVTPSATVPPVEIPETAPPENTPTPVPEVIPLPTGTLPAASSQGTTIPELYSFIQVPDGFLAEPYIYLLAFQSIPDVSIEIRGIVNSLGFVCYGTPCAVPVPLSSQIVFQAFSSAGNSSEQVSATVRVASGENGYRVYLDSISQYSTFSDACLRNWGVEDKENPVWAQFVQFPYLLNTNKTLHYLTTQLILHGVVDVEGCPSGGLSVGLDWPTGCGLERSRPTMIEWQNQFDEYIWLASKEIGIPPKILKTLIEVESQFWPGNQRFYLDELGLGQLNQLGVDVLLRRNPQVYQSVCLDVLSDCAIPYSLQTEANRQLIRGTLISSQNSLCPTCQYGLDLDNAKQSVSLIAQVVKANCETVKVIVDANLDEDLEDDWVEEEPYDDLWKLTLLSYHSGLSCFEQAIKTTAKENVTFAWENVAENVDCKGGEDYVNGVWGNLLSFENYRYTESSQKSVQVTPVFASTPTPYPTAILSSGQLVVWVFLDANQNGTPEESEWMDGVPVRFQAENGTEMVVLTVNGKAQFDLSNIPADISAEVSLPGLYRSETIQIPARGIVTLNFIFEQPTLPTAIP